MLLAASISAAAAPPPGGPTAPLAPRDCDKAPTGAAENAFVAWVHDCPFARASGEFQAGRYSSVLIATKAVRDALAPYEGRAARAYVLQSWLLEGHAAYELGRADDALAAYGFYLAPGAAADLPLDPEDLELAKQRQDELRSAYLIVTLTPDADGARISVDGHRALLDRAGRIWVDPFRDHVVVVEAPGYERAQRVVSVKGARTLEHVAVTLVGPGPAPVAPSTWRTTAAWVSAATGAEALIAATACIVVARNDRATIDDARDASGVIVRMTPERAFRLDEAANTLETASTVGFVVGGVGAAAALVFFLLPDGGDAAPSHVVVTPEAGGARIGWRQSF